MLLQQDVAGMLAFVCFRVPADDDLNFRFKGAWVSVWEKEICSDLFGDMDVVADDLPSLADGIIAVSSAK